MSKLEEKEFFNSSYFKNKKISVGSNHKISSLARFYGNKIKIGKNVRIDDDVVLKGKIKINSNVHIARGCTLSGGDKGIIIGSYTALSNFIQIFRVMCPTTIPKVFCIYFYNFFPHLWH